MNQKKLKLAKKRYSIMLTVLTQFKKGMTKTGSADLNIPECPYCPEVRNEDYCRKQCDWAKLMKSICINSGGKGNLEYIKFRNGINLALEGLTEIIEIIDNALIKD